MGRSRSKNATRAPHVPLNPIELLTRRMLERGRLADLIIDWTSGRGPSFANAVFTAVFALPAGMILRGRCRHEPAPEFG